MRFISAAVIPSAFVLAAMANVRPAWSQITSAAPAGAPTIIHAGTLLDGRGASTRNAYVIVRNGKIERVTTAPVTISGATTIELGSATLLPGLIDAHVHPGWYVDRQGKRFQELGLAWLQMDDADLMRRLLDDQRLLRLPLVRRGDTFAAGDDEAAWKRLLGVDPA